MGVRRDEAEQEEDSGPKVCHPAARLAALQVALPMAGRPAVLAASS